MPYKLQKEGSGYCVVDDAGKKYSDKPMPKWRAAAQMRALYANDPKASKKELDLMEQYMQVDRAFQKKFGPDTNSPMPIDWDSVMSCMRVYSTNLVFKKGDKFYQLDYTRTKDGIEFGVDAVEVEPAWKPVPESKAAKSFSAYKEEGGAWRWLQISGSSFRDRDGEIVTAKALKGAVDRIDAKEGSPDYGPLRWWHIGGWEFPDGVEKWETWKAGAGVDIGTCDFSMVYGNMLIESGTFKSAEIGEAIAGVSDLLGVSICFSHPADEPKNKEFENIHLIERSLLPQEFASNLLTKTVVTKGESDMDIKQKLERLAAILKGKPDVKEQILADAAAIEKAAKDAGLEFKEVSEMIAPAAEPPATATDTPAPATEPPAEEYIGDWSPAKLGEFIAAAIGSAQKAAADQATTKEAATIDALNNTVKAVQALTARMDAAEKEASETKQTLLTLTDARPKGVKEIASQRPTAKEENITSNPPNGPQIDPSFKNFARGGN